MKFSDGLLHILTMGFSMMAAFWSMWQWREIRKLADKVDAMEAKKSGTSEPAPGIRGK